MIFKLRTVRRIANGEQDMPTSERLKSIFKQPQQWGLRGDPFLWKELQEHFATGGLPENQEEFVAQVESKIKDLTSSDLGGDQPIFVARYDAGGMSSGHISPEWWRATGISLLIRQFEDCSNRLRITASGSRVQLAAQKALQECLLPATALDEKGYVESPELNLLPGIRLEYFEDELQQADGNELESKFRAAHSSTALAINSFGWFRRDGCLQHLTLLGASKVNALRFERKCRIFRGGRAPNLDAWIEFDWVRSRPTDVYASK